MEPIFQTPHYWNPKTDADLWTLSDMNALRWADDGFTGLSDSDGDSEGSDSDDPWDQTVKCFAVYREIKKSSLDGPEKTKHLHDSEANQAYT